MAACQENSTLQEEEKEVKKIQNTIHVISVGGISERDVAIIDEWIDWEIKHRTITSYVFHSSRECNRDPIFGTKYYEESKFRPSPHIVKLPI